MPIPCRCKDAEQDRVFSGRRQKAFEQMHTNNRFFDDIARVVTGAAGAAQGVRADVETALRLRMERAAQDLDLASREDVETLRDLLVKTNAEMDALRERLAALETQLASLSETGTARKPHGGSSA